jgi:hypothetical protein
LPRDLHHPIDIRAKFGANLVTCHPGNEKDRTPRTPPSRFFVSEVTLYDRQYRWDIGGYLRVRYRTFGPLKMPW